MTDFIICFWDKSKLRVNGEMAQQLKEAVIAATIKYFMIDDSLYAVNGIEKIIPVEEAYLAFPEQKFHEMDTKHPRFTPLATNNNQKVLT